MEFSSVSARSSWRCEMPVYAWEQSTVDSLALWPHHGLFNQLMIFLSHPGGWGALFWVIVFLVVFAKRLREATPLLLAAGVAAGLGDLFSRRIVKALVLRPRPHFIHEVCIQSHCWGFVSSHATNITAFATVFCLHDKRNFYWGVPLVVLVDLSRLFLADHYPLDVIGGTASGALIGTLVWKSYSLLKDRVISTKVRHELKNSN